MQVSASKAIDSIKRCLKVNKVPILTGSPGIGKSDIVRQIAKNWNLELIDVRMSTFDPVDLNGFPSIGDRRAKYIPFDTFPLEGDLLPKGKDGWLIFLDELSSAPLSVQAAAYKLILDGEVGNYPLHENVAIVAAGNSMADKAIANRMGTAMQSRLIHIDLYVDIKDWLIWASQNNIDHRIMGYLNHVPTNLHKFDPSHDDKTFACPRTWEFLSDLIDGVDTPDLRELLPLIAGTVSEAVAHEFVTYCTVYSAIPTYREIVGAPLSAKVGVEPAMQFAVAYMISAHLQKKDLKAVMEYLDRIPPEFQTICLQDVMQRDPTMEDEKLIKEWTMKKGKEVF